VLKEFVKHKYLSDAVYQNPKVKEKLFKS